MALAVGKSVRTSSTPAWEQIMPRDKEEKLRLRVTGEVRRTSLTVTSGRSLCLSTSPDIIRMAARRLDFGVGRSRSKVVWSRTTSRASATTGARPRHSDAEDHAAIAEMLLQERERFRSQVRAGFDGEGAASSRRHRRRRHEYSRPERRDEGRTIWG